MMKKHKNVVMLLAKDFRYPYLDPRVYKEAKSLVDIGYNVNVVCFSNRKKEVPLYEEYEGISIFRVFQKFPSPISLFLRMPFYGGYILKTIKKSLDLKPDVIHAHDLDTLAAGIGIKLLLNVPLIFDAHEDAPSMWESMYPNKKRIAWFIRLYEKILIKFTDRVIAAESLYTVNMKKYYNINPTIIMNFPDLAKFNPTLDASSIIKKYGLENKIVISQIGAIGNIRGTFETLEALQYIENNNVKLFLIGKVTKEMQYKLIEIVKKYKIEDKVILLPNGIRHEDIPKYYRASDISMALLYPVSTYVTSVPTKLYESLAVGVPVIAADLPHIKDIIDTYEAGLCADSQDPKDIAKKLNILIADGQMRKRMGQNGWIIAGDKFNWNNSEKILLNLYANICKR